MFKKRLLSAAIIVSVFVVLMWFSEVPFLMNIVVGILACSSVYEALVATKYIEGKDLMIACLGIAMALPLIPKLVEFTRIRGLSIDFVLLLSVFVFSLLLIITMIRNFGKYSLQHVSVMFLLTVIISLFFTSLIYLRKISYIDSKGVDKNFGVYYLYFVFIGAWITDTAAYVWGSLFGKHKLIEKISPKKTVEGAIYAIITTTVMFFVFALVLEKFCGLTVNYPLIVLAGFIASIVAQLGDLFASIIKRTFNVKDFGSVIPGHGGILDRFDSVIFVAPMLYLFFSLFHVLI